ncbi:MAG: bifunctional methylenetetrahydrofolate dehydrogenase/methenyltetrahydrofolate cyclohydrolase FolD [Armatimonadetes bacterium]|nr:bifunctional methylenetetrahydrofolate dehydrogenase/methenyltetrahydrofolate cyclohydrolase FolD [Armatimonadota bacterium]
MPANIIDGKAVAREMEEQMRAEVESLVSSGTRPGLAVVLVGDDPASKVYVGMKQKACERLGIKSIEYKLPADTSEEDVLSIVCDLNGRKDVHGILVQLPLPKHINSKKVLLMINPAKDVDGFHPLNIGNLFVDESPLPPCTPAGVMELIHRTGIDLSGKHAVVLGRSNIVGKPVSIMLLKEDATVTICHSRTVDLADICRTADVLVAAVGRPEMVKGDWIKPGAVVIDVGVNRLEDGKLVGDVEFDAAAERAAAITPVPGGVGPMTIAMLMKNTITAAKRGTGFEDIIENICAQA